MSVNPSHPTQTDPASAAGPRLVLITAEGPDESKSDPQNQIIGSEQRVAGSGGFCLTDR